MTTPALVSCEALSRLLEEAIAEEIGGSTLLRVHHPQGTVLAHVNPVDGTALLVPGGTVKFPRDEDMLGAVVLPFRRRDPTLAA